MAAVNGVMMQYFHWYVATEPGLWRQLAAEAEALAAAGFTALWLPPPYKGQAGDKDVGYGVYDLYDLGEFHQKGSVRTKYGSRDEFLAAVKAAQAAGLRVYADVVLNHKLGADAMEEIEATPYDPEDRRKPIGPPEKIKAWTEFTFPGRAGKYSAMQWHWWHFDAVDYNVYDQAEHAVYLLQGKSFDQDVDMEKGDFDFLLGCDLDVKHPEVRDELNRWGAWFVDTTGVDGFRFDAVKHVRAGFFPEWLNNCRKHAGRELYAVGEYWSGAVAALHHFISITGGMVQLFDAPLHYNFSQASRQGNAYDMRRIFDGSLVRDQPALAVTLVDNHDSQPLQSLESVVEAWFKPLAYALILLRAAGYPCVFYADYYGARYTDRGRDGKDYEIELTSHRELIDKFLHARHTWAWGEERDWFDHPNTIGWTRGGDADHPGGMAVTMTNGAAGSKRMQLAPSRNYIDLTGHVDATVTTDDQGWADFPCAGGSVSVWVPSYSG